MPWIMRWQQSCISRYSFFTIAISQITASSKMSKAYVITTQISWAVLPSIKIWGYTDLDLCMKHETSLYFFTLGLQKNCKELCHYIPVIECSPSRMTGENFAHDRSVCTCCHELRSYAKMKTLKQLMAQEVSTPFNVGRHSTKNAKPMAREANLDSSYKTRCVNNVPSPVRTISLLFEDPLSTRHSAGAHVLKCVFSMATSASALLQLGMENSDYRRRLLLRCRTPRPCRQLWKRRDGNNADRKIDRCHRFQRLQDTQVCSHCVISCLLIQVRSSAESTNAK